MGSFTFGAWRWLGPALALLTACAPLATPEPPRSPSPTAPARPATATLAATAPTRNPPTAPPAFTATPEPPGWLAARCALPDSSSVSPTGAWAAADCHDTSAQLLVGANDGVVWTIGGEPLSVRQILRRRPLLWSADGRYLYFTQTAHRSGDDAHAFAAVGSVYRLTLASGDTIEIVRSVNNLPAFSVAVDSGGARLAFLPSDAPERVTVIDLQSYAPLKIALGVVIAAAGDLTWSPDGDRLLLSAVLADGRGTLIMIEPATQTILALATPEDRVMRILAWPPGELLALRDEAWPAPGAWTLHLATGEYLRQIAEEQP